jgi:GNAT superfamily N-acetyltransferase
MAFVNTANGVWAVEVAAPSEPEAAAVLRDYLAEMISRYHGRETDDEEIDRHLRAGHDSDDLVPPSGLLLLARRSGRVVGCVGLRRAVPGCGGSEATAELTRMFVRPDARGEGGAVLLLEAAERNALALGMRSIRLNTRGDLVEARALYAKSGYVETQPFGDDPFAEYWFEKVLAAEAVGVQGEDGRE